MSHVCLNSLLEFPFFLSALLLYLLNKKYGTHISTRRHRNMLLNIQQKENFKELRQLFICFTLLFTLLFGFSVTDFSSFIFYKPLFSVIKKDFLYWKETREKRPVACGLRNIIICCCSTFSLLIIFVKSLFSLFLLRIICFYMYFFLYRNQGALGCLIFFQYICHTHKKGK